MSTPLQDVEADVTSEKTAFLPQSEQPSSSVPCTYKFGFLGISVSKKEVLALLILFIVYVLIGGAVFMAIESPAEESTRHELVTEQRQFREKLKFFDHPNFTQTEIEHIITTLADAKSMNLVDEHGNITRINWSFYNSFFFAITVVTTIGYGHLAPSTVPGRIFCVFYAVIGIPMTGILLAAIGDHFSKHLMKSLERAKKYYSSKVALAINAFTFLLPWFVVFMILPAGIFTMLENWTFIEGLYYCFITLSTIGFGDYVAANFDRDYIWIYKTGVVLWIIFGLGYLAMILNYISRAMRCKHIRRVERRLSTSFHHTQQKFGQRIDEIYHILQEFSKKQPKNGRHGMPRVQSFPNPETPILQEEKETVRDKNHNRDYQIQRLLNLVQSLKDDNKYPHRHRQPYHPRRLKGQIEALDLATQGALPQRRHSLPIVLVSSVEDETQQDSKPINRSHLEFIGPCFSNNNNNNNHNNNNSNHSTPNRRISHLTAIGIDLESLQSTSV